MKLTTKINKEYGGYAREAYVKLQSTLNSKQAHKTKFVIFGRGRSGSTLLSNILNSSPLIYCDKEILNRPVCNPRKFISNRAGLFNAEIYGFKFLSYQLQSIQKIDAPKEFLKKMVEFEGYKMIFMTRSNLLRQTLSKHYAYARNVWHQKKQSESRIKMKIDPHVLLKNLNEGRMLEDFENSVIDTLPYLEVNYEKNLLDTEKQNELIKELAQYFNINTFEPKIKLNKITSNKYADFIENHEEMVDFISKTAFSSYLES